jgi:hypothetical protein
MDGRGRAIMPPRRCRSGDLFAGAFFRARFVWTCDIGVRRSRGGPAPRAFLFEAFSAYARAAARALGAPFEGSFHHKLQAFRPLHAP